MQARQRAGKQNEAKTRIQKQDKSLFLVIEFLVYFGVSEDSLEGGIWPLFPRVIPGSLIVESQWLFTVRRKKEAAEDNIGTTKKASMEERSSNVWRFIRLIVMCTQLDDSNNIVLKEVLCESIDLIIIISVPHSLQILKKTTTKP